MVATIEEGQKQERSPAVGEALGAIVQAKAAVKAYEREDLTGRLEAAREKLEDPAFHVLVVGEFKQGKSSLINALLNAPVCPVDDDIATSAPTAVSWSEQPTAAVLYRAADEPADADGERPEPEREKIDFDRVHEYVTEGANPENERRVHSVEVGIPRQLLADGLVLVDTPGVGGLGSAHSSITIGALPMADAVIFVSDASQEFSGPELDFLKTARSMCPNLLCVLTKTDFYPEWRKIKELDEGHLKDARVKTVILPISSTLRAQAVEADDQELNDESGFPAMVGYLQREVIANADALTVKAACNDIIGVVDQLAAQFTAELKSLQDPEQAAEVMRQLESAKEQADRLRGQAAKWQQTLGDGVADLQGDVDHDLRTRIRRIMQESDEVIEATDPADTWEEFEPWLYRRVGEDIANNYQYLQLRAQELSRRVAEHFAADEEQVALEFTVGDPIQLVDQVGVEAQIEVEVMGAGQKLWTGVRGGYMGVIMFSMLGGMIGLALGPLLPVAAGLVLGRKSLRDEKERQLAMRRNQAKNAMRKYIDEVQFQLAKDSRDTLRRVNRQLRDHYMARAEELMRSVTETLNAAQQNAKGDAATRQKRLKDVSAELDRVKKLRQNVRKVATEAAAPAP
ncbi:MAG: dynamin family protein [Acidimicrobiia bacterium]